MYYYKHIDSDMVSLDSNLGCDKLAKIGENKMQINVANIEITNYHTDSENGIFHMDISCNASIENNDVLVETDADYLASSNTPLEFGDITYFDKNKDEIAYLEGNDYDEVIAKIKVEVNKLLKEQGFTPNT